MSKPHQAKAPSSRGSAERTCSIAPRTEPPSTAPAVRRRPVPSVGVQTAAATASAMASVASGRGHGGEHERALAVDGERPAGQRDRAEEDGVDDDQEGQQRRGGPARAEPGAPQRPQRHRRAADAGRRQQPRRGGAAERDLGALAQAQPRRGAAADQPQQQDVAAEREQLEDGGGQDPGGIGVDRAADGVGERVQRPAEEQHGRDQRDGGSGGHSGPARQRAEVERGEREVLDGHTSSIGTRPTPRIRDITSMRVRGAAPGWCAIRAIPVALREVLGSGSREQSRPVPRRCRWLAAAFGRAVGAHAARGPRQGRPPSVPAPARRAPPSRGAARCRAERRGSRLPRRRASRARRRSWRRARRAHRRSAPAPTRRPGPAARSRSRPGARRSRPPAAARPPPGRPADGSCRP